MPSVKVDARNLGNALREHARGMDAAVRAAAVDTCHRGVAAAVQMADGDGLVDQGAYKRGFRVANNIKGPELRNDTPYAAVLEHGRRPNRPGPPVAPIREWVARKLGLSGAELERVAWAIRTAIHKRGTRPHKIMFRTQLLMRVWFRAAVEARLRAK